MNEKLFGKIVIVLMSLGLLCAVALPAVRNGGAFRVWVIGLPISIVAVSAYLAYRRSRKRVTPMSVTAFLWIWMCAPLIFMVGAVGADYGFRHGDTYRKAIGMARYSEMCNRELGPDWQVAWPIEGEAQTDGRAGRLFLEIPLAGNGQKGSLRVKATKTAGIWKIDEVTLLLANGHVEQIQKAELNPGPQQEKTNREPSSSASPANQPITEADQNEGVRELLGPMGSILIYALLSPFLFLAGIFYILTLQRAMMRCAPESRDFDNSFLWKSLIPFVGLVIHLFVVMGIAKSFRKEFERRGISGVDPNSGRTLGIVMCLCCPGALVPLVGLLVAIAGLVLWIMYWSRIAKLSRKLNSSLVGTA